MNRTCVCIAVFITVMSGSCLNASDLTVDALVSRSMKHWGVPGTAVVVVHQGKVIHSAGYGVTSNEAPQAVTDETIFPLGSCTKAFTAALLATFVADGKASFDDPVMKHLPYFELADARSNELVTLRDLLGHRTGVDSHEYLWFKAPWSQVESVKRMRYLPQTGPFRGSYHYSTLNYLALGQAIEQIGGQPWQRLMQERILDSLKMNDVQFTTRTTGPRALGHQRDAEGRVVRMPEYLLKEPNPAGSLFLPAKAIAPWMLAHLKASKVLPLLDELHKPITLMPMDDTTIGPTYPDTVQVSYAMGWVVYDWRGHKVLGHGGILDGFRSQILLFPNEQLGIALFGNLHQSKMNIALGHELAEHVLELPHHRPLHMYYRLLENAEQTRKQNAINLRNAARQAQQLPAWPAARYAGVYRHPAYGDVTVTWDGQRLAWSWSSFAGTVTPFEYEKFRVDSDTFTEELLEFRSDARGPNALRFGAVIYSRP